MVWIGGSAVFAAVRYPVHRHSLAIALIVEQRWMGELKMYKQLSDSTLQRMKKKDIIELLRIAEHNAKVAQEFVDQQAQNFKDWAPVVHGRWEYTPQTFNTLGMIRCSFCEWWSLDPSIDGIYKYCPNCGAKMDLRNYEEMQ